MPGWERLRHGGLLLDATRLAALSRHVPGPLYDRVGRQLRQRAGAISDADADSGAVSSFVVFVLEEVCGLDASTGAWTRGSNVSPSWGRRAITGETVKPCHLWTGTNGARLPVFLDGGRRLGVGRGRRIVSQVLDWLRADNDHLALVTNGRQWRLLFAGLDYVARFMQPSPDKGPSTGTVPAYNIDVVDEAIVNAVAHRDYAIAGSKIRLFLFADRLELYSPGKLPNPDFSPKKH